MNIFTTKIEDGKITLFAHGQIDTSNAGQAETEVNEARENPHDSVVLDLEDLKYISSAGLRVVLKIKKAETDFIITNVSTEVYEVFDMTGFTEMMDIKKAYRKIDVEGCKVIGQGAKGVVYRYSPDSIVKVYKNKDDFDSILRERELAKKAFVLGVPTAISFDIVKVGDNFGSMFELLDCQSMSQYIAENPDKVDECAKKFAELLKTIHSTEADETLPDATPMGYKWLNGCKDALPEATFAKIEKMIEAIPKCNNMVHCDYHTNNIMMQGDEVLLIDMDTIARGNPIYELANTYTAHVGFGEEDPEQTTEFIGFPYELSVQFWNTFLAEYLSGKDSSYINRVTIATQILSKLRILRKALVRGNANPDKDVFREERYKKEIVELVDQIDSLEMDTDF